MEIKIRQKKFRVWDKAEKKMLYFDIDNLLGGDVELSSNCSEIMDYVGIDEKNERDIYENDIYRLPANMHHIEIIGVVQFLQTGFRLVSLFSKTGWDLNYAEPEMEYLGNIFDNPFYKYIDNKMVRKAGK